MQGIYSYVSETNHVFWVYNIKANPWLQFMVHVLLFPVINILYFYIIIIIFSFREPTSGSVLLKRTTSRYDALTTDVAVHIVAKYEYPHRLNSRTLHHKLYSCFRFSEAYKSGLSRCIL